MARLSVNVGRNWKSVKVMLYPTVKTDTDWVKLVFVSSLMRDKPATEPPSSSNH
jgi:hypothetical protein